MSPGSPGRAMERTSATDAARFRRAMSSFATGVTVVSVQSPDGLRHGMTVNSFSSVSLDPMLVLVCLSWSSRSLTLIRQAAVFGINVLASDQEAVSRWFADRRRPADSTAFDGVPTELGPLGSPTLLAAAAVFECRLHRVIPAGDHAIVLGEVDWFRHRPDAEPLVFHSGGYRFLGCAGDAGRATRSAATGQ